MGVKLALSNLKVVARELTILQSNLVGQDSRSCLCEGMYNSGPPPLHSVVPPPRQHLEPTHLSVLRVVLSDGL